MPHYSSMRQVALNIKIFRYFRLPSRWFGAAPRVALTLTLAAAFHDGSCAAAAFAAAGGSSATARVDKVFGYYQDLRDFSADFQQVKVLRVEGMELRSRGTLTVSLGRSLLWNVTSPARMAVFLDGTTLQMRAGEGAGEKRTTYDLKSSGLSEKIADQMQELTALLAMDRVLLAKHYDLTPEPAGLLLTPHKPRQFARVRMRLASGRWIDRIEIDEASGDRLLLDFAPPTKVDRNWTDAWNKAG
jgi:hypothetical protein